MIIKNKLESINKINQLNLNKFPEQLFREKEETKKDNKKENKNEQNNRPDFQNSFEDKMKSVFGDLNIDSDKALLLSLILLLSEEKADELLIMALIYMLT